MGMDVAERTSTHPQNLGKSAAGHRKEKESYTSIEPGASEQASPRQLTPLQVNETRAVTAGDAFFSYQRSPKSSTAARTIGDIQHSPRSPRSKMAASPVKSSSPKDERPVTRETQTAEAFGDAEGSSMRKMLASPPKSHSYSQLRNVSSPLPQAMRIGHSSPPSPRSTTSPAPAGNTDRPESRPMPRTSSIDSAISLATVHSQRPSQDTTSGLPDISNLVQTAGSPEALIHHLLKEKQHIELQNTQLWKLVDKQRSLVLGLNQDLEKAIKDKEKYRKKLREQLDRVPPIPPATAKPSISQMPLKNHSPAPSDTSTELPIQGHNQEHVVAKGPQGNMGQTAQIRQPNSEEGVPSSGEMTGTQVAKDSWVQSENRAHEPKHSHQATSSSDIGVIGPLRIVQPVARIQTGDQSTSMQQESTSQASPSARPVTSPTTSFTAKRSQPHSGKAFHGPALSLTESTPPGNDTDRMTPPRKAPPAPLDLGPKRDNALQTQSEPIDHSESDYDEDMEVDELPAIERGRKKTREEDDREREAALLREQQSRSNSKKEKSSKSRTASAKSRPQELDKGAEAHAVPFTPSFKAFSPEPMPGGASAFLSPPTSLASVLSPSEIQTGSGTTERLISAKPMSPGLPLSPRPNHRPVNPPTPRLPRDGTAPAVASPPISPRNGFVGLPLSPRAPRQPIPLPPHTPVSLASPRHHNSETHNPTDASAHESTSPSKTSSASGPSQPDGFASSLRSEVVATRGPYKGFMSEAYPDLLLPPNALPWILVKVVSSRLKPSRHSMVLKGSEEEPVFTLGILARSDDQTLWQVEKPAASLQQLDQHLRQFCTISVKQPDRSLFNGHAPAKVDARRIALERYFEVLLDTLMDEKSALILCRYLSTQILESSNGESFDTTMTPHPASPTFQGLDGKPFKEGYLTKKGKNFGGWKARFFVLDGPILRYYETPGGSLLGTIKLHVAKIGKQSTRISESPSRDDEDDGSFRHAFLIREPKRKDSNSLIDHVLCAESDIERDAWVAALLCYVEVSASDAKSRPSLSKSDSGSQKMLAPSKKNSLKKDVLSANSPDSETFESLQAVPYENTLAAQAPLVQITPDPRPTADSPSPTTSGSQPSLRSASAQSKTISGPQNGAKISDVGAWGNKPMAPSIGFPKEQKKRSIWGFRDRNASDIVANHPNDSNLSLTQQQYQEQITNVKAAFGAPLAEAVEYCGPRGIDVCLPAVVYRCLEYLNMKDAASEEGIFRMSGSNTLIKGLKSRFNAEGDFDLLGDEEPYYDVHAVASLLKQYLRDLPQPILTRELHLEFIGVLELPDTSKKTAAYNILVHRLPKPNFTLLRALSSFLITIISNSETNKMSIRNVGIVFSPTLNIPGPVISTLLTDFDAIFGDAPDDDAVSPLQAKSNDSLTPEDIRSPRRQMFSEIPTPSYNQATFSKNQSAGNHNQAPNLERTLHNTRTGGDTGFVPLQPSYNTSATEQESVTVPGPEYAVARPRNLAPGGPAKARRRESSMLLMGGVQPKSSLPIMRDDADMQHEESTYS